MTCPCKNKGLGAAPATYTVTFPQDQDGLSGIVVRLGLCEAPAQNTMSAWQPCLNIAKQIAEHNGIDWYTGSDGYPHADIYNGQVLKIPAALRGGFEKNKKFILAGVVIGSLILLRSLTSRRS